MRILRQNAQKQPFLTPKWQKLAPPFMTTNYVPILSRLDLYLVEPNEDIGAYLVISIPTMEIDAYEMPEEEEEWFVEFNKRQPLLSMKAFPDACCTWRFSGMHLHADSTYHLHTCQGKRGLREIVDLMERCWSVARERFDFEELVSQFDDGDYLEHMEKK